MGNYIDSDDLIQRFPILDTGSSALIESTMIAPAEAEVESALASAFTVPFEGAHPTVVDLCLSSAYVKEMMVRKPKEFKPLREDLLARFERLRSGVESITTGSGTLLTASDDDSLPDSTTREYHPVHSMLGTGHADTAIDDDRLDDLEDTRQ